MVTIQKTKTETSFEVRGLHKVLAFKSSLTIPNSHIVRAYHDIDEIKNWSGLRALGTSVPYLIKAGTFYSAPDSSTVFMDISNPDNSIIVVLRDEKYQKLYIEVEDPQTAISLLTRNASS
jgi:hypothetical protein